MTERRPLRRRLVVAFAGLVLLAGGAGWSWLSRGGLPQRTGTAPVLGIGSEVVVQFDDAGVPHITGASVLDLAHAVGFLHANDRMTQLELGRRLAAGRLAEIVGDVALPSDRYFIGLGMRSHARAGVEALSAESRALLEAYAAGVNAWLEQRGTDLPPELRLLGVRPEPWEPIDSLYFQLQMAHQLSFFEGRPEEDRYVALQDLGAERLVDLMAGRAPHLPAEILSLAGVAAPAGTAPPPDPGARRIGGLGSNNWILGASRSTTSAPIVANDPHLPVGLPGIWFQATLRAPDYNATGVTLPGFPMILIGQTESISWALTNVMLDDHDIFFEDARDDLTQVRRGADWLNVTVRQEQLIHEDGSSEIVDVRMTDLGVLLAPIPERGLPARSLAWTTATAGDLPSIGMTLARAQRVQDLIGQLENHISPAQNLVVGDREGGVLFTAIGRVPMRGAGDGQLPSPAWDAAYHWQGLHPQISNRTVINPDTDFFVTANHRIEGTTGEGRAPVPGAEFDTPYRAQRIFELLLARERWSPEDIASVQSDVVSAYALHLTELLAGDYEGDAATAYAMLASWDGTMAGSGAPALFTLLERHLRSRIFDETAAHGVGRIASRWRLVHVVSGAAAHDWFDDESTTNVETREEILAAALSSAWAEASALWGEAPENWSYGAIHRLHLDNPLGSVPLLGGWFNRGPLPFPGSATTVAAFGGAEGDGWQRIAYGPSMRWVSSLADPDGSLAIMPLGQSGHPADPHYDDQLEAYETGGMRPVRWSHEAAAAAAVSSLTLVPADMTMR